MVHGGDVTERCFKSIFTSTCLQTITLAKSWKHIRCCGTYWPVQTTLITISGGQAISRRSLWELTRLYRIRRTAAAIVLKIAYGHIVADEGDSYVALAEAAMRTSAHAGFFGTYLVDYIPILKYVPSWMPGASFKRKAREWRRLSREMLESQFKIVKQKMVSRATE
jgi:hypothetical protein